MQIRFPTPHDGNFSFKKQIQFSRKRTFRAARAFGDRLDATERFRTTRNDQTRVAELSCPKKDRLCAFHSTLSNTRTIEALQCASRVILSIAKRSRKIPWRYHRVLQRDSSTSLGMTFCSNPDFAVGSFISMMTDAGKNY